MTEEKKPVEAEEAAKLLGKVIRRRPKKPVKTETI